MTNFGQKLIIGCFGTAGVEAAQHIEVPTSTDTKDIVTIIVQIVIGIATIIGIFKKKKSNN
jgi:uncharacterized membrane protein YphA (DoxX/SURF4 family)